MAWAKGHEKASKKIQVGGLPATCQNKEKKNKSPNRHRQRTGESEVLDRGQKKKRGTCAKTLKTSKEERKLHIPG